MPREAIHIGKVERLEYEVSRPGDFQPLLGELAFYRVQAILDGRIQAAGPRQRKLPRLPAQRIRALRDVRSAADGSWSKGCNGYYAYNNASASAAP